MAVRSNSNSPFTRRARTKAEIACTTTDVAYQNQVTVFEVAIDPRRRLRMQGFVGRECPSICLDPCIECRQRFFQQSEAFEFGNACGFDRQLPRIFMER